MKEKKFRKAYFFVVYAIDKDKIKYVIQKRKLHWIGWEFPKGGAEKFELAKTTVKREIKEEIGLPIIKIKNHRRKGKYFYPQIYADRPEIVGQTFKLFSVQVHYGKIKIDKKEHSSAKWVTYKQAQKLLTWENQKKCLKLVNNWITHNEPSNTQNKK